MDRPVFSKKPPEVKPWVRRVVEASGTAVPDSPSGEALLGWWGVEMSRFLHYCRSLPAGTGLGAALEGYGRYLKSSEPPPADWQLDQAREALRCFRKGIENWTLLPAEGEWGHCTRDSHLRWVASISQFNGIRCFLRLP